MDYCLNLSRISLADYRDLLKQQNLLPGRRLLLDDIDAHFAALAAQNLATLAELRQRLSNPQKLASLALAAGISEDYLTILKRESGSLEQKPILLSAFPGIEPHVVAQWNAKGYTNSREVFERGASEPSEMFSLCDLARINGVGAVAARAFFEAGFASVEAVANANPADMLQRVARVNAEKQYYKANLGEKDMQFCIDFARLLVRYSK